jgi:hypothetical protein
MENVPSPAIETFVGHLNRRLSTGVRTTEDGVRYTFYAALLEHGIRPEAVILEDLHAEMKGARVDTLILDNLGRPAIAMEFKYDRGIPGGRNQPRTQKAGAVFRDLGRLLTVGAVHLRLFVYLTDRELADYFLNPANGLDRFFGLMPAATLPLDTPFFVGWAPAFHTAMRPWPGSARLRGVASETLERDHFLRIYEIEPAGPVPQEPPLPS